MQISEFQIIQLLNIVRASINGAPYVICGYSPNDREKLIKEIENQQNKEVLDVGGKKE